MHFKIDNLALLRVLQPFRGVIQASNTLIPATGFLHSKVEQRADGKTSLLLTASNSTVEISQRLSDVEIIDLGKGEAMLSARKLQLICDNSFEKTSFTFKCSDHLVEITSDSNQFELGSLAPSQFPHMETNVAPNMDFSIRSEDLCRLLNQTEYAMAKVSDPRDYLKGVMLAVEGEKMVAVATDGHRLAQCSVQYKAKGQEDRRVVLPASAIKEIKNVATRSGADERVSMLADDKVVVVETAKLKIKAKVYEEKRYPDYKRVIPNEIAYNATVDSDDFRQALAKMKVIDTTFAVIELRKGEMRINSKNEQEHEKVKIKQKVDYAGEEFRVGVNHEYLAQIFNVIESEKAIFKFTDASSAMLITEKDGGDTQHIVMPLRL